MANNKNKVIVVALTVTAVIAVIVAVCLYLDNERNKEKIAELEEDKLRLILDSLQKNPDLSEEIKRQLQQLIERFKKIDIKISNEVAQALQLYQIGQKENAIEDLVKIIEHLLRMHYRNDSKCKQWLKRQKKKFDLHNLLDYCKEEKKIDKIEHQFFIAIKTIRNEEDHTLDLKLDDYLTASGIITAIGGISKLAAIVYPNEDAA